MPREHVEHIHAPDLDWEPLTWPGWPEGARVKVFSRDEETGALSSLVSLPAGWRRPAGHVSAETELVVTSGSLRVGGRDLPRLSYEYAAPGGSVDEWETDGEAELLFMTRTGAPDLLDGPGPAGKERKIQLVPDELEWVPSRFPNGPVGTESAAYRMEPNGEMSTMVRLHGTTERSGKFEFHDCVEECYLLEGGIIIWNSFTEGGEMRAGTYFWRPPYVVHGDGYRTGDGYLYVYTDSALVNRFTDGFHRTPEENREQSLREQAAAAAG